MAFPVIICQIYLQTFNPFQPKLGEGLIPRRMYVPMAEGLSLDLINLNFADQRKAGAYIVKRSELFDNLQKPNQLANAPGSSLNVTPKMHKSDSNAHKIKINHQRALTTVEKEINFSRRSITAIFPDALQFGAAIRAVMCDDQTLTIASQKWSIELKGSMDNFTHSLTQQ